MSWSNQTATQRREYRQWRADRAASAMAALSSASADRVPPRPIGRPLKASEVPGLVQKALVAGGPIAPGEPFEHLLIVCSTNDYLLMYHFLVAEPVSPEGPRRVIMLSDRTIHMSLRLTTPVRDFVQAVQEYSGALGAPRVLIADDGVNHLMCHSIKNDMHWTVGWWAYNQLCTGRHSGYGNNITVGLVLYREALARGAVSHPNQQELARFAKSAKVQPHKSGPRDAPAEVVDIDNDLGRDLTALCLAYMEGPLSALDAARRQFQL